MTAIAYPFNPMLWDATVTKIHDGDTCTLDVDLKRYVRVKDQTIGFHLYVEGDHLHLHNPTRLFGINAPELITDAGKAAQSYLATLIPIGSKILLATWLDQNDKYGRVLGRIVRASDGLDVNQAMVDSGNAAIYYGAGPKPVP